MNYVVNESQDKFHLVEKQNKTRIHKKRLNVFIKKIILKTQFTREQTLENEGNMNDSCYTINVCVPLQ